MDDGGRPDWVDELMITEKGGFFGNSYNATLVLRQDSCFRGAIGLNVRGAQVWARRATPAGPEGPWSDAHTTACCNWLQRKGFAVTPTTVDRVVELVAREHPVNPVGTWLESRGWDGTSRLDAWLPRYLGCTDTELHRALGPLFLKAAAMRGIQPGCQQDGCPVLEGPEGILKSSAVRLLAGPWGAESLPAFGTKDASLIAARSWIIELSELSAMLRSHVAETNSFLTRTKDVFRLPYGRHVIEQLRGCFFIGTVNPSTFGYIRDSAGGRRCWPIQCGVIDLPALRQDLDQLWGEAVTRLHAGETWWPGAELKDLIDLQLDRHEGDAWEPQVLQAVEDLESPFTLERVIHKAFPGLLTVEIDRAMQTRVGQILSNRRPPLIHDRVTIGGTRVRTYSKPTGTGGQG
jgi:predicted P-loop ATPase